MLVILREFFDDIFVNMNCIKILFKLISLINNFNLNFQNMLMHQMLIKIGDLI
jgi:hypothetical protein